MAMKNAKSSTHAAVCGNRLLTQRPHWPCCLNSKDGFNTLPGSLSFYLWEPSGLSFPGLIDRLIDLARARHRDRRRTTFSYDSKLIQQFGRGGVKGKATRASPS